jgi:25S rRNA (uracil2634-N3)-methyltransferase
MDLGAGIKDQDRNVLSNQQLILRTLRSVHPILTEGPPLDIQSLNRKRKRQLQDDDSDHERSPSPSLYLEDDIEDSQPIPIPSTFTPPNRQGSLLITLLNQNPYTLWNLPKLATKPPPPPPSHSATQTEKPQPKYKLIRSFEFRPEVYPGYAHRRTIGFKEGLSKGDNEEIKGRKGAARTWEFVGVETPAEKGYGE